MCSLCHFRQFYFAILVAVERFDLKQKQKINIKNRLFLSSFCVVKRTTRFKLVYRNSNSLATKLLNLFLSFVSKLRREYL